MERLNEIIARTQRHQHDTEQRLPRDNGRPAQAQRPAPGARYPLPEQTARLGSGSRTRYQQTPPARSEYGQSMQQARHPIHPPRQRLESHEPGGSTPYQQHARTDEYPRNEGFVPKRERNWGAPGSAPADSVDAHSPMTQADVLEEWEDDTAGIRYGDWENDGIEEYAPYRSQEPGAGANNWTVARNPHAYPRGDQPLTTRKLPSDAESRTQGSRTTVDPRVQPKQIPAPQHIPQEALRSLRTTQPLRPQAAVRTGQEQPQEGPYAQKPVPRREQAAPQIPVGLCPICKGAGYLRADVPYGHPNFGKPIACECKEAERKEKRRQQLLEMSDLRAFRNQTFESFNPNVSRSVQKAYHVIREYAQDPYGWLLLIGPNGCGKTHLAAAVANSYLACGSLVLFTTAIDLLDHLRATYMPTSTEVYDQLFAKMREAELLVLDDLGAQQSSPWANEKLFQLLNYRYNSRFPTIITTNNLGLQGIDERLRSRMMDASLVTTVIFEGAQDYRPRNPRRD